VTNTRNAAGAVGVEATGGNSGSAAIKATNPNDGPALALNTAGTVPPFKVTSAVRVKNLNADRLDNLDATDFYRARRKGADSDSLDGQDSSAFLRADAKAGDADKLDGKDSSEFGQSTALTVGGTAGVIRATPTVYAHLDLPPGSYLLLAKLTFNVFAEA